MNKNQKKSESLCCLCDFRLDLRALGGLSNHVFEAEYIFLEKIYSEK